MANPWLLLLVQTDESTFPEKDVYTQLPNHLDQVIGRILPDKSLDLTALYLLPEEQKNRIEKSLNKAALNYHHYAVDIRGERCAEEDCELHEKNVLSFNDHRARRPTSPGVN